VDADMSMLARLNKLSLKQHWAIGVFTLMLIGFLHYSSGALTRIELLCLAPILYITWFIGMEIGLLFSVSSLIVLKATDAMIGRKVLNNADDFWQIVMNLAFFVIITVLFSKLVYVNRQLEQQATKDALTGIFNRNKFNEVLRYETLRALRYKTPLSLIMCDVDHFKRINDSYGHAIGDDVLKDLCVIISTHIRDTDYFARWGGEEFALLVTNTEAGNARILAEKLRVSIQNAPLLAAETITCSFGVAQFLDSDTVDSFIKHADDRLYQAKNKGRNKVV
jgi:diguanylate cyclase (GGDEF)-like protein